MLNIRVLSHYLSLAVSFLLAGVVIIMETGNEAGLLDS